MSRVRRRYDDDLTSLAPGLPGVAQMHACYQTLLGRYPDTASALRVLRHLVLERLATLDCDAGATLADVTQTMTYLAEFALDTAYHQARATLDAQHGAPQAEAGADPSGEARLWIVGMGKLGARELNVSSDIDLIYIYDPTGHTRGDAQGRGVVTNQEYFELLVKQMQSLIGEISEHGFVFRVDLALRPHGASGPSALSLAALEDYLLLHGREWERFAWLKSRVVAPQVHTQNGAALPLRALVRPFVFRRYLDYSVFEALRKLHGQIRAHANERASARTTPAGIDLKLGRGGIREIEFIVQLLQVVRGGQFAELRTRATLSALARLSKAGLMTPERAQELAQAYEFLRRAEHRIQYLDDQQTHQLPRNEDDLAWLAQAMGLPSRAAFMERLQHWRDLVAAEFDRLLGAGAQDAATSTQLSDTATPSEAALTPALQERLLRWRAHPRVLALREQARHRLERVLQRSVLWVTQMLAQGPDAQALGERAFERLLDWLEPMLRRDSYLALLLERPGVHERLLRLLGAARWPARYLIRHPGVIDELASSQLLDERFSASEFERELEQRKAALAAAHEDDDEALLNLLRRAHHAEVFRTLARDIEGRISVEQVADDLSALADTMLRVATQWCWQRSKQRHREHPRLGIVGYGKLGGKELGYGSDLDIVFVYDDDDERAPEAYAALARKLITWLTVKTAEGDIYEIDTALRPNGNAGLLVSSFAAFERYQLQRGSNTAWTWEHQAMTRARCVLSPLPAPQEPTRQETAASATTSPASPISPASDFVARFEAVRHAVIAAPRDSATLKTEILAMRERVRAAHPVKEGLFDVKHSPGAMVDVEFAVQYLVLSQAAQHPALRDNVGNIALLRQAQALQLLPHGVGEAAAQAYAQLRRVQHQARLNEEPTQVPLAQLAPQQQAVLALWYAAFDLAPK